MDVLDSFTAVMLKYLFKLQGHISGWTPDANMTHQRMFTVWSVVVLLHLSSVSGKGVLLIIGGDAGLQLGAYNNTDVRTPHLDELAKNGVVFTRAFSSSVSGGSASRSAILTGLPAHQNGMFGSRSDLSPFNSYREVLGVSSILSAQGIKTGIIGINSLGPDSVYKYDYSQTEANNDPLTIGRNITRINELVSDFFSQYRMENFFLVISLADAERCSEPSYGQFCENYGDGQASTGSIPDWSPVSYNGSLLKLPYFVPDLEDARQDLANMYRSVSRLDQGIGLYITSLVDAGLFATTLVIYTSTGGVSFPGAKYNAWDGGANVPLIIGSSGTSLSKVSDALVSSLDITPTIFDYLGIQLPQYSILGKRVTLTGQSLIPLLTNPTKSGQTEVFLTQNFIEVNDDITIRAIRNDTYKLIWNKFEKFPIVSEVFNSPTFIRLANLTKGREKTYWWRDLRSYTTRGQYELYDFTFDPYEVMNVADESRYQQTLQELQHKLAAWQRATNDPWLCPRDHVNIDGTCETYA
ncbi:unnamed protein product [Lymnaea stagnalis]|uniref:Sulfatase N-terminal domain-containing protein n=1 Tax=Lymnaea stagnalis TaxID=6523 RepID=A0AAV2HKV6_LYMST